LYQLKLVTNEVLPDMFLQIFKLHCKTENGNIFTAETNQVLTRTWIENVWQYIHSRGIEDVRIFKNVPLIPLFEGKKPENVLNGQEQGKSIAVQFFCLEGKYMLTEYENMPTLPAPVQKVILLTGIQLFPPAKTISFYYENVIGKFIKLPTAENVIGCFEFLQSDTLISEVSRKINNICTDKERASFARYLDEHCSAITPCSQDLLKEIQMFYQSDNIQHPEIVSWNDNKFTVNASPFPKGLSYPRSFLLFDCANLLTKFETIEVNKCQLIGEVVPLMLTGTKYKSEDKRKFMIYLKGQPTNVLDVVLIKAMDIDFIPSDDGRYHRVKDLFDPTSGRLKDLFCGKKGVFPDEEFVNQNNLITFLSQLGIKKERDISSKDLIEAAYEVNNVNDSENRRCKAKALISILVDSPDSISKEEFEEIKELKWIPCCRKKPKSYPCKLELYGKEAKFCSPKEVKHFQFVNIIGTIKPLVDVFQSESKVSLFYEWNSQPDVELVIRHLEKMMQVYSKNDNSKYISMSKDIFRFLDQQRKKGLLDINRLQTLNCVPTDIYGFKSAKTVVLKMHCIELQYSLKLEPYIFQLAQELACYHELFHEIGVKSMVDFKMLESVLIQIRDRYHTTTDRNADNFEIMQDRKFTVDILKHIVSMDIDRDLMMGLYVPVMSDDDSLVFDCVKNCTFSEDVRNLNEDTGVVFVHPDISEVASMLGITSLTKRTLEKSTVFIPWGQKEPLTTTIANELESYADGFSIPKELLQNADDAKAKRIGFLYDERENNDLQAKLFDKGMAECQGQALWVYNDAMFQQKDFVNILNIGGKTKLMDNDKIGKFGLGFSSVYNITDVPSFISGDTLVVLDPHLNHLGDAVQNNEPGVRVKITKDIMTIYKNQFKPFEGIFGCKLDTDDDGKFNFKGTLFRFPLRTYTQATRSKIKSTEYRKREMIELLHKLISGAANLLLFTQNVTELVVYHLDGKSSNPELDQQLLYKVAKSNVGSEDEPFLQTVVTRNHLHKGSKQISRIQTIDIKFNLTDKIQLLSTHLKPFSGKQSWIVSWDTGKTSFDLEKRLRKNGAVTIGSVAIPVDSQGKILQLSKVPEGFYSVSHLFCFLPLPQQTSLPLHINGCFMTSRDRRCIVTYNEDDISNENWQWNDALLTDVVQNAYINLASFITSKSLFSNVLEGYWEAWPFSTENDRTISHLVTSFYKNVLERDPVVFYRKTKDTVICCSFSHMLFLEPTFRNVQTIGQIAFESLINFYQGPKTVIDMSVEVFKMFDMANKKIHEKLISKDKFYETYFFPNMTDNYWKSPSRSNQRDILLKFALENQTLHELIKTIECIPVKQSETLRKPSDLVSLTGSVSNMFDINDQCFLRDDFEAYTSTLGEMGMMVDAVTSKVLLERACSLETVKNLNLNEALQRSSSIMKYLNNAIENHQDVTSSLKKIPFLPVMSKPENWPSIIPWKNDTLERDKTFLPPENLFLSEDRFLISAIGFICDHNDHTKVLQLIGIKVVETKDVIEQLKEIGSLNIGINYEIKEMCSRIYCYINKHLGNYPDNLVKRELKHLQNSNIVFIKDKMVSPSKVSINLESDCDPYLFEVDPIFREYTALWNNMHIPRYFDLDIFLNVLQERSNQLMETKMPTADVKSIVNILKNICSLLKREKRELKRTEKDQLFIPDTQCILRSIENICFDDEYKGVLFGENQLNCIHHFVKNEFGIVETLGIKPKRTLHLSRYSNVLPFGQKEKLVARIRGIISAYPRDHSILNELLQNADDAGATEVHFVLDMRHHRTQHVFNDSWKKFQGPALTVYNNSCFSETDLDKIQELGHGSKSDDPTKTGQFGIGFNAVYHLTDVPSFLTRGPSTPEGSTFCVFDPHCTNVLMVDQNSTGLRLDDVNILQQSYQDVYNTYLQNELVSDEGTWFRFPLRTKDMAEKSEISDTIVDENSVTKMFLTMKSNMKKSLLFLTNVRNISLSYIEKDGKKLSGTECAFSQMDSEDSQRKHNFVHNSNFQLKSLQDEKLDLRKFKYMEVRYNVNLHDSTGYDERWLIVETFGFPDIKDVPAEVVKAFNGKEIMLSPKGGAATCIESYNRETKDKKYSEMENGRAFCFLPLPIPTGLPVHINGHFALSSNRTQIFGGLFRDDIRYMWNRCIVDQTLAYAYAGLLKFYQQKIENCKNRHAVKKFFDCFPVFVFAKEDIWKDLTFSTYKSIIRQDLNIFPVIPSFKRHECSIHPLSQQLEQNQNFKIKKWVPLQSTHGMFPAFFDDLQFGTTFLDASEGTTRSTRRCSFYGEQNLREVLIDLGMNIICVPIGISKSINQSCSRRVHIREPYKELKKTKMNKSLPEKKIENIDKNQRKHCICSKSVTPIVVIDFLKSWNSRASDKCAISVCSGKLLDDTPVRDIGRLMSVLEFCLMGNIKSIDELEGAPLLVRNDNSLTAFCTENNLILSKYCELFPRSADKFVHQSVWQILMAFKESFKQLEITSFSKLLPYTLERSIYENVKPIDWISSENKLDEKWLTMLWEFLNTQDNIINVLKNWCLLPCLWFNKENKLVSFQMAYCLFHEERVEVSKDNLNKIMVKLKIPTPNTEICGTKHLSDIVATVFKPSKFVDCLHFHRKTVLWKNLTRDECDQLLTYFNNSTDSLDFLTLSKLKTLFLFTTVSENIVQLDDTQKVFVVKSSDCMTVFDGIDDLCIAKKTILIKHNSSHEKLYGKIGCILCYETKKKKNKSSKFKHPLLGLYKQFILPNFCHLNPEAHTPHLTFIRYELLSFEEIKVELPNLEFVPTKSFSRYQKACAFYSPHNSLLRELCNDSELPSAPFSESDWKEFMEYAGMKCTVSLQMVINFAKTIQQNGNSTCSERQSKLLIEHLFSLSNLENDTYLLSTISQINFITPCTVPDEYRSICIPKSDERLMSFQDSITPGYIDLCWTMEVLLPEYAVPTNGLILKHLNVKEQPDLKCVVSHIHKVCESFQRYGIQKKNKSFIKDLMETFYKYLSKLPELSMTEAKVMLEHTAIIYFVEHGRFLPASSVVVHLQKEFEIPPYMLKCSDCYGDYFHLFETLGATDNVSIHQYTNILATMKNKAQEKPLTVHELKSFECAFEALLYCLENYTSKDADKDSEMHLYLLNEKNVLKLASNLTINDRNVFRLRIGNVKQFDFMCDLKPLKLGFNPVARLLRLPENSRPKTITQSVKEKVVSTDSITPSDVAAKLERFLTGDLFSYAILRLMKTFQINKNMKIRESEFKQVTDQLKKLRVRALVTLKTVLVYKKEDCKGSIINKTVFYAQEENVMYVEYQKNLTESWLSRNIIWISDGIQEIAFKKIYISDIQAIIPFLELSRTELEEELNKLGFVDADYKFEGISWFPLPGTPVQEEFLGFLSSEFDSFEAGDYAVYEVFDNTGDDINDVVSVYIYVKIVEQLKDDLETFPLYVINTGDEVELKIRSHRLYNVIRPELNTSADIQLYTRSQVEQTIDQKEQIFQTVEIFLVHAWRLGPDEFKNVVRRLVLRWHPDKNENSSFCGEVFKHLTNFATRLQSGEIDVSKIDVRRNYENGQWEEYLRNATCLGDDVDGASKGYTFDIHGFANRVGTKRPRDCQHHGSSFQNPQPHMGRIWIKQARFDMSAAQLSLTTATERTYNWVCVQSHQAAEKALKAAQIVEDSSKVGNDHFLTKYITFRNPTLRDASKKLENLVVNYSRMRYPRITSYPLAPSELYTKEQAEESVRLAAVIVDSVEDQFF
ncbi:sacsin, partial [Mytilus galloprovincialis]